MKQMLFIPIGIGMLVWISHYWVIQNFGVNIPFWDQWGTEAEVYTHYLEGKLSFSFFFKSFNEHRIVFTRLFSLLTFIINGGWDPKAVMILQAFFPALTAAIFSHFLLKTQKLDAVTLSILGVILLAFALPYYWENILWSFQNQFYFMILLGTISILLYGKKLTWIRIALIGFLNTIIYFSMASGVLVLMPSMGMTLLHIFRHKREWKKGISLLILQSGILWMQIVLWVSPQDHLKLKAHNGIEFLVALKNILSWPIPPYGMILTWGSLMILLGIRISQSGSLLLYLLKARLTELILLHFSLWILLQELGIAFARANGYVYSSRYQLIYGMFFVILAFYMSTLWRNRQIQSLKFLMIAYNSLLCALLIYQMAVKESPQLLNKAITTTQMKNNLLTALQTDDMSSLYIQDTQVSPDLERLVEVLFHPQLRNYHLWAGKQTPIAFTRLTSSNRQFADNNFSSGSVQQPYLIITSDIHLSAVEGRWQQTTRKFENFLDQFHKFPPDKIFIAGDVIDNAIEHGDGKVTSGEISHWQKEIDIYHAIKKKYAKIEFRQSLGPGHDFGDVSLAQAEQAFSVSKGSFIWQGVTFIWINIERASFNNDAPLYHDVLPISDYAWLSQQITEATEAVILFHVPIRTLSTYAAGRWFNKQNLTIDSRDALYTLIRQNSHKIKAIFNGHIHHPVQTLYHGIPLYICPFVVNGCHCLLSKKNDTLNVQPIQCTE